MRLMYRLAMLFLLAGSAVADDWPQYRGPNRDDVSAEKGLLTKWPDAGPPLLATFENAGVGYSGFAIVGERLYTIGGRGDEEFLIAVDLQTIADGKVREVWSAKVGPLFTWKGNSWSAGPSSTPTVDGDRIYALGGMGDLVCVNKDDGKEVWRKNLPKELAAAVNPIGGGPKGLGWGFTWSPLVDGDQLICLPGGPKGTVAALDKKTGEVRWRSEGLNDLAAYTSPMAMTVAGVRMYAVLTNQGLSGVSAANGKVLWSFRRVRPYGTEVVNSPVVSGDFVYTTVGAGQGCDLFRVKKAGDMFEVENLWTNRNLQNHHGNVLLHDGSVYGFSEGKGWVCQDVKTGDNRWEEKSKLRAGSVTFADGRLYGYGEDDGTCVLVDASPAGWKEAGRFKIPKQSKLKQPRGKIWTPPVVSNGKLFLRDQELLFVYDVKTK